MSMSKKDFIALADELRYTLGDKSENKTSLVSRDTVLADLCRFMQRSNLAFKENRWRSYLAGECGKNGGKVK